MKIHWIYNIIPIPVFYVKHIKNFSGKSYGIFIFIEENYNDDIGLLEHELQHCRQFYRTFGMNGIFYLLSKKYQYTMEIEAYRIQLLYSDNSEGALQHFITFITTKYDFVVTAEKVREDLLK